MDSQILVGMLAFQNNLVTREQLIQAFTTWTGSPAQSLSEVLVNQGSLGSEERERIEQLVQAFQVNSDQEAESLALFSSCSSLHDELSQIASQPNSMVRGVDLFSKAAEFGIGSSTTHVEPKVGGMDRFRIVKEHARGGLGVVFVAEDKQLRREVALKQIRVDRADIGAFRQKFNFEAEVTGQLEHPGIVPIYALGSDNRGRPFYAMRFIQGESLKEEIKTHHENLLKVPKQHDSPELRQLLRRFIDVCNAIDYAHDQGILHRDLKPGNIMLGRHGETLVVDWGLAKAFRGIDTSPNNGGSIVDDSGTSSDKGSGGATRDGGFVGTATYAPPEQLRGEHSKLCPASDVYSLGGILFEILAGRPPIEQSSSIDEVLGQIQSRQQTGIRTIRPATPLPLAFVCEKALRSEIGDRYRRVSELRDAVQCWLDDQAVPGMSEPLATKLVRWIRNHQSIAASSLVGLVSAAILITLLGVGSYIAWHRETVLRDKAEKANLDLLLNDAQLARNRGQFRDAATKMQQVEERVKLTDEQTLSLVSDLYNAEDYRPALSMIGSIDRSQLSSQSVARLDLVYGDLQLYTRDEKAGFERIKTALESGLLNPADQAFGQALLEESAIGCQRQLRECLRHNPIHIGAITNLAFTCFVLGDLNEAKSRMELGLALFPDDPRLSVMSALIAGKTADKDAFKSAIEKLRASGGQDKEIRAVEIVSRIHRLLELQLSNMNTLNLKLNAIAINEALDLGLQLIKNGRAHGDSPDMFGLPNNNWIGNLEKSLFNPSSLAKILLPNGFGKFIGSARDQLPNNQLLNYLSGCYLLNEDRNGEAGIAFMRAAECDIISESLSTKSVWFAFACFVRHEKTTGIPMEPKDVVQLHQWIIERRARDGKYVTEPMPVANVWNIMVSYRMYHEAAELAQQEFASASPTEQPAWQTRIEQLAEFQKRITQTIDVVFSGNPE